MNLMNVLKSDKGYLIGNCDYYNIEDLEHVTISGKHEYSFMHLNIQGLPSKFDNLKMMLHRIEIYGKKFDFILLCETFLTDRNVHLYNILGYNLIYRNRTNSNRRGVAVYLKDGFEYCERPDICINVDGEFESLFIEIKSVEHKIILGEIYRIPDTNEKTSIERFNTILEKLNTEKCDQILATDQNFDYAKINTHKNTSDLFDIFYSRNFIPTITKPTRITHSSATIIDNIYVKGNNNFKMISGILTCNISDHLPIFTFTTRKKKHQDRAPLKFKCRSLSEPNINNIINFLTNNNWDVLDNMTSEDGYNYFINHLSQVIDKFAPEKVVIIPKTHIIREPWMSLGLLKSSQTKDKLYRKYILSERSEASHTKFIIYRNQFHKIKRIAKETYYKTLLPRYKNDIRKTWGVVNIPIGRTRNKSTIADKFSIDGNDVNDPDIISNGFCKYFTEICKQLADKIPRGTKSFNEYMITNPNANSFYLVLTSRDKVLQIIKSLRKKKVLGMMVLAHI